MQKHCKLFEFLHAISDTNFRPIVSILLYPECKTYWCYHDGKFTNQSTFEHISVRKGGVRTHKEMSDRVPTLPMGELKFG